MAFAVVACISAPSVVPACASDAKITSENAAQDAVIIEGLSGPAAKLTESDLAQLPSVSITVSFETEHGLHKASFEGPLLWTVLVHAGVIDPTKPREQVRQAVMVTGRDGYTAVLALGEIAPDFEAKQVILADQMDGQPLDTAHVRIVVPGDRRGGRSVREVSRITIMPPYKAKT